MISIYTCSSRGNMAILRSARSDRRLLIGGAFSRFPLISFGPDYAHIEILSDSFSFTSAHVHIVVVHWTHIYWYMR